jgi:hypothetical protein
MLGKVTVCEVLPRGASLLWKSFTENSLFESIQIVEN